jgi:hypothetical protein
MNTEDSERDTRPVYRIKGWCADAKVSTSFYHKIQKQHRGPHVTHLEGVTLITETPREYLKRMAAENASAQPLEVA